MNVVLGIVSELVAPTRCAACDERVLPRVLFCAGCVASVERAGPQPDEQHAVFAYGGAVATAIVRLKYGGRFDLASRFGSVMAALLPALASEVDVVVPVPMHPARLAERGFDQAALLAAGVARGLRIPWLPRALVRTRATPRQASLDRADRAANVAQAFRPRGGCLAGKRVLLVDDVRTTGSTLAACVEALVAVGASRACSLVLAARDRAEKAGPNDDDDG